MKFAQIGYWLTVLCKEKSRNCSVALRVDIPHNDSCESQCENHKLGFNQLNKEALAYLHLQ
jgi:hypothetical protein